MKQIDILTITELNDFSAIVGNRTYHEYDGKAGGSSRSRLLTAICADGWTIEHYSAHLTHYNTQAHSFVLSRESQPKPQAIWICPTHGEVPCQEFATFCPKCHPPGPKT